MTSQPGLQTIAVHILPNVSQSKGNQIMKFGQLIQYYKRNNFFKNYVENETSRLVRSRLVQFQYISIALSLPYNKNTNCIKLWTIDPETCSIFIFQKRVWVYFLHQILCMIFREKYFSCYILLADQISFSDCL